jgi:hypothetical protein
MESIVEPAVLQRRVAGYNVAPGAMVADLVAAGPTLLVFLRHHG